MLIRLQHIYIFYCSMLLYYHSWMFYNHFISFLVLTYWHSAKCCFLHVFYIAGNQYQTESKCSETFCGFFMDQKTPNGLEKHLWGALRVAQPTRTRPGRWCPPQLTPLGFLEYWGIYRAKRRCGRPRRAQVGCAPLGAPLWYFFGPLDVFCSKKNPQKVSLRLDSVWYWFPAM